ncbi:MAG: bifunctional UDP-N-acetylmuramoyl-tripeptide:D-alanyl-D-alanine ligase/alanine racemase [Bacteroidetes bacterium GWF2_38_335]|nr:MAG: bifunctional UDP-N-acetylmuramoyl-tripeptide:D-alanyl-D-alanine ligase/alanine racemase [Bacteroidetes bacterium GWF2_38_335]OFY78472.1 MAG: bifunctional UDP-N-acetylmuramoyl-tripeptide:D-alanyl-D-alanine ligase/alanine racemase [Bacteroidetes bacterium RIFOXYA12_FULL_38_20]HBS88419.1 bifunctional UDP-N-acetylmuramoyl-tripeptide:D-alanyl-D-alanine ligase/alanine racemase [Bacteroidales bacterium]
MPSYSINDITKIIGGKITGGFDYTINYLLTDSRSLSSPLNSLFFALVGDRHNGHNYIEDLYQKNVRNFVVSKLPSNIEEYPEANFILTDNTLKALQKLSAGHRDSFDIPVIGITGSNGKTILKEWLFQLLQKDHNIVRSPKSYNSQIGVPLSVWLLEKDTQMGIFEAGISKSGEMNNLQKIIKPTIGLFTNIGEAHQENFMDYKHKISEKIKLFEDAEYLIYCKDYQLIEMQVQSNTNFEDCKLFNWSAKYPADLFITKKLKGESETTISGKHKGKNINLVIPFTDDASIENAIHGWSVMLCMGYENEVIAERMMHLTPVAMRLELKEGNNNCVIINDSYNSDIGSLNIALDFLDQQQQLQEKTLILSDILQSGKEEKHLYSEVANLVNKKKISRFIGIGPNISKYADLIKVKKNFFFSTDELIGELNALDIRDSIILLKGARKFEFEKISRLLQHKVHETVLEINLTAITNNLNYFKSLVRHDVKIMVMVKAFSYGSGILEVANLLQFQRTDYLCVAFPDEGVELRKGGITLPIVVLNAEIQSFDLMIENNLEPEIYSFRVFELFRDAIIRNHLNNFNVHLKLDTGMNRLGFRTEDIPELLGLLKITPQFTVKSVFTHLAASEDTNEDAFTNLQIDLFKKHSHDIINTLKYPVMRHVLNSAGIERFPEAQFDMVRLGIGLYGISSRDQSKVQNVTTLKTSVSQIKKLKKGDTIGYNRTAVAKNNTVIAVLPIGYADGLNRKLSNGVGKVQIKNEFAPFIGNICMDMCMIDVTGMDVKEGDEVVIFGDHYHISEIARQLGTIPYEVMTGISRRVKRIYYQE